MSSDTESRCTAFVGGHRVAQGSYAQVAQALAGLPPSDQSLLVFDDSTGAQVDHPWPAGFGEPEPSPAPAVPAVGRPRLGVVAREVTLLPRHWDWLAHQPGGASAALRRLVDEARRLHERSDLQRASRERAYRCMSALAGNWPGFEAATRALFAGDRAAFRQLSGGWPADASQYLDWLARDAFEAPAEADSQG